MSDERVTKEELANLELTKLGLVSEPLKIIQHRSLCAAIVENQVLGIQIVK